MPKYYFGFDSNNINFELPSNENGTGITTVRNTSENNGAGSLLYTDISGTLKLVDNRDPSRLPCRYISAQSGTGLIKVLLHGYVRNDSWNWTPNAKLYISDVPGGITDTYPSRGYSQYIGKAVASNIILFDPDKTVIELVEGYVPLGLIVGLNDTVIPTGWSQFSAPNNKMLIGAGSTYSPATSGGDNTKTGSFGSTSTAGSHLGTGSFNAYFVEAGGPSQYLSWSNQVSGDHSHAFTTMTYNPLCNEILLIKSTQVNEKLPINSVTFSDGNLDPTDLTNILTNGRYLKANSSLGLSGSTNASFSGGSTGHHRHDYECCPGQLIGFGGWTSSCYVEATGGHGASFGKTVTENLKKVQLSAWTHASQVIDMRSSMIAMWESTEAPGGWKLCNGSNGTPDLRDCFINTVPSGAEVPTPAGNNTINAGSHSATIQHDILHSHRGYCTGSGRPYAAGVYHNEETWDHSHSLSVSLGTISVLPAYYALTFIMKM